MDVIISYDVDKNSQKEVKDALIQNNFKEEIENNGVIYKMPNTTLLYQESETPVEVKDIFDDVIRELNQSRRSNQQISATRFIAFGINIIDGIEGDSNDEESPITTLEQKKDYCLYALYKAIEPSFLGGVYPFDEFEKKGIHLEEQELQRIVNGLQASDLIYVQRIRGTTKIIFDTRGKGVDFIEKNSFSSPGTPILELFK